MATIDRSENIRKREKIVKEIAKTSDSIRKKLRALKTGKIVKDIELDAHFKPLIEPLQKIADNSISVKKEESDSVADAGIETLPFQHEKEEEGEEEDQENATLKMRKRSNSWLDLKSTPHKSNQSKRSKVLPITSTPSTVEIVQHTIPKLLANDVMFETTDESIATSVRKQLQTSTGRVTFIQALQDHLGPLGRKYIGLFLSATPTIDTVYGVYFSSHGMMLGSKRFDVDSADNIYVDGVRYAGTPGIYELIFKRMPDDEIYTEDDKQKYKSILLATSAHKFKHDARERVLSNRGHKYKYVIAPLISIESKKKKSGKGLCMPRAMTLTDNKIDYVHWDDPNELVDRLRLLDASRQAGHNGHDNEILSLIEELCEAGLIIN